MSLFSGLFKTTPAPKTGGGDDTADASLHIRASDAGWTYVVLDPKGDVTSEAHGNCYPEGGTALTSYALAAAVAALEGKGLTARIGNVVVLADDADLSLVDHRQAKLTNFEPRALKEFGAQQTGGRAAAFASHPFGASAAREIERRILAFLPEEKLEDFFFGLGKLATSLVAVAPGAIASLSAPELTGVFGLLRVHGYFSQLIVGNAESGIIAMRRLPFGALTLAQSFAVEHGVSLEQASVALAERSRVPPHEALSDEASPEHRTATYAALAPHLRRLAAELHATLDYFRFERLGGRPISLQMTFSGPRIAGLDDFIAAACDIGCAVAEESAVVPTGSESGVALNLLEGSRTGLLKIGSQNFEFSGGRFKPLNPTQSGAAMKPPSGLAAHLPFLKNPRLQALANTKISLSRDQVMNAVAVFGPLTFIAVLNANFLKTPADAALITAVSNYGTAAQANTEMVTRSATEDGPALAARTPLWANDLVSLSAALLPDMVLSRIEMTTADPTSKAYVLNVEGTLPPDSATNLKLVAGFIDRLGSDAAFKRRLPDIKFTGAGAPTDPEATKMTFTVTARAPAEAPQ